MEAEEEAPQEGDMVVVEEEEVMEGARTTIMEAFWFGTSHLIAGYLLYYEGCKIYSVLNLV